MTFKLSIVNNFDTVLIKITLLRDPTLYNDDDELEFNDASTLLGH